MQGVQIRSKTDEEKCDEIRTLGRYLSETSRRDHLTLLDLSCNNLGDDGAMRLALSMRGRRIKRLIIKDNNIGDDGIECIAKSLKFSIITSLDASHNNIRNKGANYLANAIIHSQVIDLDLRKNDIGVYAVEYLSNVFDNWGSLFIDIHYTKERDRYVTQGFVCNMDTTYLTLCGNQVSHNIARYINSTFKNRRIMRLELDKKEKILPHTVEYLRRAFENIEIGTMAVHRSHLHCKSLENFVKIFKNSRIREIIVSADGFSCRSFKDFSTLLDEVKVYKFNFSFNGICLNGLNNLTTVLRTRHIRYLDLGYNYIGNEGARCLGRNLKYTQLASLVLPYNEIGDFGARDLAEGLRDSAVTHIDLFENLLTNEGVQFFADVFPYTQVTSADFNNNFTSGDPTSIYKSALEGNKASVEKFYATCRAILHQNDENELEFILSGESEAFDHLINFVDTLTSVPQTRNHLWDKFPKAKNLDEFVENIDDRFNLFLNDHLPQLLSLSDNCDYVEVLKKFENLGLTTVVENLLLHRELYYIDEDQEILHPYVYKLLHKYELPLFHEQMEPNKKVYILSYFCNNWKDGEGRDVINLLLS